MSSSPFAVPSSCLAVWIALPKPDGKLFLWSWHSNDYNLNISRYVLPKEEKINLDAEINELSKKLLQLDAELAEAESEVNKWLHELRIEIQQTEQLSLPELE